MTTVTERFEGAVFTLVGDGPVKQRLAQAYGDHLAGMRSDDLPASLGELFGGLRSALERVGPCGNETRAEATIRKMSYHEAGLHAGTIFRIFRELARVTARGESVKESLRVVDKVADHDHDHDHDHDQDSTPRYLAVRNG